MGSVPAGHIRGTGHSDVLLFGEERPAAPLRIASVEEEESMLGEPRQGAPILPPPSSSPLPPPPFFSSFPFSPLFLSLSLPPPLSLSLSLSLSLLQTHTLT